MDLTPNLCDIPLNGAGERILDIRPAMDFCAGHLPGAVSQPVTAPSPSTTATEHFEDELPSIFLPPREVPLLVVGADPSWNTDFAANLQDRGRAPVRHLNVAAIAPGALSETGPSGAHLWSAPPWLVDHADLLPPPSAGPVLDLACGSGRAAVWMAARGYQVTGIDWQPEALEFGRQLAASRGVEVIWQKADLRQPDAVPVGRRGTRGIRRRNTVWVAANCPAIFLRVIAKYWPTKKATIPMAARPQGSWLVAASKIIYLSRVTFWVCFCCSPSTRTM